MSISNNLKVCITRNWLTIICIVLINAITFTRSESGPLCFKNDVYANKPSKSLPDCVRSTARLVSEGPNIQGIPKGSSYLSNNTIPEWFDPELAYIGQKFARKNAAGIYLAAFVSFLFFVADTDTRRILVDTRKSITPEGSLKRYLTNFVHIQLWFDEDIRNDHTILFESLNSVRFRHQAALHRSETFEEQMSKPFIPEPANGENPRGIDTRIWKAFQQDLESSRFRLFKKPSTDRMKGNKIKFNQYALSVAHLLHYGLPVMIPQKFLIYDATEEELKGYLHLWAFIGKAVGIQDEYNVCLQPDVDTARAYLRNFIEQYLVPTIFNLDYETKYMYEALFKGLNNAFSNTENLKRTKWPNSIEFFLSSLLEDVLEIPIPHLRAVLTRRERLATASFKLFARPENFRRTRELTNGMARGLFRIWTMQKFGIDTRNSTAVAEKLYV